MIISARALMKSFGESQNQVCILNELDFEVPEHQTTYIVGPSGSGKSTLLSILGCILQPDSGELVIANRDTGVMNRNELARFRLETIGFAFQRFHLFRGLSALENVQVPLMLLGRSQRDAKADSLAVLSQLNLENHSNADVRKMSLGQQQRVAIARAIVTRPRILLADEPTASLDAENGQSAMELLCRTCDEYSATLLVVTHDSRIYHFADRIVEIENGRLGELNQELATADR